MVLFRTISWYGRVEALNEGWRGTDEGGMLKEAGTENWLAPNLGATNTAGLNFRPAGYRDSTNVSMFSERGETLNIWTSTEITGEANAVAYSRHKFDSSQIEKKKVEKSWIFNKMYKQNGKSTVIYTVLITMKLHLKFLCKQKF